MKTASAEHKRGDTFKKACHRDADLTDWTLKSQIRDAAGILVADCDVTITDAQNGLFTIRVEAEDTASWPVDYLNWDIEYTDSAGDVESTETIRLRVRADVTYEEVMP